MRGNSRSSSVAALVVVLFNSSLVEAAVTGDEIIRKMQESFGKHKTFSVHFEKDFYWALLDTKQESRNGRIFTRRTGDFRGEVEKGYLSGGSSAGIWSFSSQNRQVVVSDYDGEFRTPWEILVDYADTYRPIAVAEVDLMGRPSYELTLLPAASTSQVARLKVWVDRKKWHLLKVERVEVNDNVTTSRLPGHKTNKKLDDSLFRYRVPEGLQVIDRREVVPTDAR